MTSFLNGKKNTQNSTGKQLRWSIKKDNPNNTNELFNINHFKDMTEHVKSQGKSGRFNDILKKMILKNSYITMKIFLMAMTSQMDQLLHLK